MSFLWKLFISFYFELNNNDLTLKINHLDNNRGSSSGNNQGSGKDIPKGLSKELYKIKLPVVNILSLYSHLTDSLNLKLALSKRFFWYSRYLLAFKFLLDDRPYRHGLSFEMG